MVSEMVSALFRGTNSIPVRWIPNSNCFPLRPTTSPPSPDSIQIFGFYKKFLLGRSRHATRFLDQSLARNNSWKFCWKSHNIDDTLTLNNRSSRKRSVFTTTSAYRIASEIEFVGIQCDSITTQTYATNVTKREDSLNKIRYIKFPLK